MINIFAARTWMIVVHSLYCFYATTKTVHSRPELSSARGYLHCAGASFLFLYCSKTFFAEIYFQFYNLQFCTPTVLQGGGRGPAARQEGGRDLFVNKKNYLRGRPWREPAAPLPGGRPPAATPLGGRGGGRLPLPRKIAAVGH